LIACSHVPKEGRMTTGQSGGVGRSLEVEPLTAEAFAAFGEVLAAHESPSFDLPTKQLFRFAWSASSETILQIIAFRPQPMLVPRLEQHWHVTESRMHIGGPAAVIVVAPPSRTAPSFSQLRAFKLDRQGVMFRKGTWHGLDAFPLGDEPSEFLFLSDRRTQSELFDNPVERPELSAFHDFAADEVISISA
jgi:ureidoglycolate hydrolase